jgi:hypothetical protein
MVLQCWYIIRLLLKMVSNFFFIILGFMLGALGTVLGAVTRGIESIFNTSFNTAVSQYLAYAYYVQGVLPIFPDNSMTGLASTVGMFTIFGYGLVFLTVWFSFKLVLLVIRMVPIFGRAYDRVNTGGTATTSVRFDKMGKSMGSSKSYSRRV